MKLNISTFVIALIYLFLQSPTVSSSTKILNEENESSIRSIITSNYTPDFDQSEFLVTCINISQNDENLLNVIAFQEHYASSNRTVGIILEIENSNLSSLFTGDSLMGFGYFGADISMSFNDIDAIHHYILKTFRSSTELIIGKKAYKLENLKHFVSTFMDVGLISEFNLDTLFMNNFERLFSECNKDQTIWSYHDKLIAEAQDSIAELMQTASFTKQ